MTTGERIETNKVIKKLDFENNSNLEESLVKGKNIIYDKAIIFLMFKFIFK